MKLSACHHIDSTTGEVPKGETTAHWRIDIGNGVVTTASITNEVVGELRLKAGDKAIAVIKASPVMVGTP